MVTCVPCRSVAISGRFWGFRGALLRDLSTFRQEAKKTKSFQLGATVSKSDLLTFGQFNFKASKSHTVKPRVVSKASGLVFSDPELASSPFEDDAGKCRVPPVATRQSFLETEFEEQRLPGNPRSPPRRTWQVMSESRGCCGGYPLKQGVHSKARSQKRSVASPKIP